jgi:hypothetical protein
LIFQQDIQKFSAINIVDVFNSVKAQLTLESVKYTKLIDQDGTLIYIGEATPGTANSASTWRISRIDETNDPDLTILWANSEVSFNKVWDNRLTYTYG